MNKTELINVVAHKLEVSKKEAGQLVSTVIDTIIEGTKTEGECVIPELGKLVLADVPARSGTSMGVQWSKPAHQLLKLKLSKAGKAQTGV